MLVSRAPVTEVTEVVDKAQEPDTHKVLNTGLREETHTSPL